MRLTVHERGEIESGETQEQDRAPNQQSQVPLLRRRLEGIVIILGSFILAALVVRYKWHVERDLAAIGPFAYPLAIVLFTIVASAPFSVTDALAIMNGVLFGPLWGSVVNAIGIVCAAIVGYLVARRTSSLLDLDAQVAKLPNWVKRFRIGSPAFLVAVRIIPGLGGTLATQVAAAFRVPIIVQVWTMSVIAIPICTLLAIFGDQAAVAVHKWYIEHRPHVNMHFHNPFHRHHPQAPPQTQPH